MTMSPFLRISVLCCLLSVLTISIPAQYHVIPEPDDMSLGMAEFQFTDQTVVAANKYAMPEAELFVEWLTRATGISYRLVDIDNVTQTNYVLLTCNKRVEDLTPDKLKDVPDSIARLLLESNKSAYRLNINPKGILINAEFNEGLFYGTQTLRQLFPATSEEGHVALPLIFNSVMIKDVARFNHRGLLLDCCRHFMSVDFVKQYIDLLAYYKMNVLHWHLTEDQGWRIQIDRYPLLTEVGAWRTQKDGSRYGGFYTKEQIREIVAYAARRHVTIIPEIELPGHSTAAIAAYPTLSCTQEPIKVENEWGVFKDIYCAGNDETFAFLQHVFDEVCELFPGPYIHIGGDEAPKFRWEHCDRCKKRMRDEGIKTEAELQTYFIERIAAYLSAKGKRIIGWDEILEGGIPADAAIQSWRGMQGGRDAALHGHSAIMSPTSHCYFDYGLATIDLKKVYAFDPIPLELTPAQAKLIRGGECNMWTEHAPQEKVDSKVFPRMLALSEVLWTYPLNRDYSSFYKRVKDHFIRLKAMDVQFGFPQIPVEVSANSKTAGEMEVVVHQSMPDVEIRYALSKPDASLDDHSMRSLNGPIVVTSATRLDVSAVFAGIPYPEALQWWFEPHLAFGRPITLNYTPSPWYTGGGENALVDGRLGSSNFRDGVWQAVQGKDMEAIIDLGEARQINEVQTQWFMYGNAWIFLPESVEFWISDDGLNWTGLGKAQSEVDERTPGELKDIIGLKKLGKKARFVRMKATNHGPCPTWHDAPGEPSWLFCDEWIIR